MEITKNKFGCINCNSYIIKSGYDGNNCMVHARCCELPDGRIIATAQPLSVKGSDLFSELMISTCEKFGEEFTKFSPVPEFERIQNPDGTYTLGCDMTPFYHKKTGKVLITGHNVKYSADSLHPAPNNRKTWYTSFDPNENPVKYEKMKPLELPEHEIYYNYGSGSGQIIELENGNLLIAIYHRRAENKIFMSSVMHCSFDGFALNLLEIGNNLCISEGEPRGVYEPSLVHFGGKYYMTLRADNFGYVSVSDDGLNYSEPVLWRFDDGEILPNYNTQQHWLVCKDSLYLVYTRKCGTNDHVFRHRAPLFAAKIDTQKLAVIRSSEFVAVPERGARLGNFGVHNTPDGRALIMAAEWMQPVGCEAYGSNNSIFLVEIKEQKELRVEN